MTGEDLGGRAATPDPTGEDRLQYSADHRLSSTITPAIGEFHPAANLFPLIEEPALAELAADIAEHGLREPIWRHRDGRIIDGRNRWLACQRAGVECRHRTYEKPDDTILGFVVSKNLHRRHLTTSQRAAVAADIANLGRGANQHTVKAPSVEGTSQADAAKLMSVSIASVERAAAVKRADPELHEKVKAGEVTAGRARTIIAASAPPPAPAQGDNPEPTADKVTADGEEEENDGDRALAAIMGVAKLKFSGTKAAKDWTWSDADIALAEKAATWLKMFIYVARKERRVAQLRAVSP